MDRRQFLQNTVGALAGASLISSCTSSSSNVNGLKLDRIGLQLYTVRDLMHEDVPGTLRQIAELGYDEVEFAGYYGYESADLRSMLDDLGLTAPSCHRDLLDLNGDLNEVIDTSQALGHEYVVLPWLQEQERQTIDDYRRLAESCNHIGETLAGAGIAFAYHHHDFELIPIDGEIPLYVLMDEVEPSAMKFQIDTFWTVKAGIRLRTASLPINTS